VESQEKEVPLDPQDLLGLLDLPGQEGLLVLQVLLDREALQVSVVMLVQQELLEHQALQDSQVLPAPLDLKGLLAQVERGGHVVLQGLLECPGLKDLLDLQGLLDPQGHEDQPEQLVLQVQ